MPRKTPLPPPAPRTEEPSCSWRCQLRIAGLTYGLLAVGYVLLRIWMP